MSEKNKALVFLELLKSMTKEGQLTEIQKIILQEKGIELGLTSETISRLIDLEYSPESTHDETRKLNLASAVNKYNFPYVFSSSFWRGGPLLTPHWLTIEKGFVTWEKRNAYLINVDSISIPVSKISSIELDTGIIGTRVMIKSFGAGTILVKSFSKSDAKTVKRILESMI